MLVALFVFEEKGGSLPMCRKPAFVRQAEAEILLKAASFTDLKTQVKTFSQAQKAVRLSEEFSLLWCH